jgi:hypothetical protein
LTRKLVSKEGQGDAVEHAAAERPSRTNLLLSATIEADGVAGPVRIRNLSESGAMLEGAVLPPVGTRLILRRLHLEIGATVIWQDKSRCGVRFDGTIVVAGWREGNWIAPAGRGGRLRKRNDRSESNDEGEVANAETDARIADELVILRHLLDDLGAQLVERSTEPERLVALQQFDIAAQTLGHLADVLRAEDRLKAIDKIGLDSLRLRLLEPRAEPNT